MTPADVIENAIRRQPQSDVHTLARAIAADLDGHGMLAVASASRRPTKAKREVQYCGGDCHRVELQGNTCPICGWSPTS